VAFGALACSFPDKLSRPALATRKWPRDAARHAAERPAAATRRLVIAPEVAGVKNTSAPVVTVRPPFREFAVALLTQRVKGATTNSWLGAGARDASRGGRFSQDCSEGAVKLLAQVALRFRLPP